MNRLLETAILALAAFVAAKLAIILTGGIQLS